MTLEAAFTVTNPKLGKINIYYLFQQKHYVNFYCKVYDQVGLNVIEELFILIINIMRFLFIGDF